MKKVFSIISAGLLLLSAVSCVNEDLATFEPSQATAPVLGSYEVGEKAITATYTPATFKMGFNESMPVNHSLAIVSLDGQPVSKTIASTAKNGSASVTVAALSKILTGMGGSVGQSVNLELVVRASMQDPTKDNGKNGYVDSEGRIAVTGFIIQEPASNPYEGFNEASAWGVTGSIASAGINWDKDIAMVSDGTWHVAKSVTLTSSDQFKFRKDAGWDVNVGAAGDVEPFVVTLDTEISGSAGGKNLAVEADGTYDLWLNPETNSFKVTEAYNPYPEYSEESTWSLIGALSAYGINWDGDIAAMTDGSDKYLVQGVTLSKDDAFKFRKDQAWTDNMGATGDVEPFVVTIDTPVAATAGGKNLSVPADGVYDIILDKSGATITVVETLGGPASKKIGGNSGGDDDDPTETAWSLIGTIAGTSWDTDTDLTKQSGDFWVVRNVTFTASDEFKIRKNHDWTESYGGPEANSTSTIDAGNPYDVFKPVLGTAFAAGSMNIQVGVAGTYDVTFNAADMTILIEEHQAVFHSSELSAALLGPRTSR